MIEESALSDHKQDESFRVIDRRPFTSEGELRKDVVEEQERETKREAAKTPPAPAGETKAPVTPPPVETPKRLGAFENLVRMLGQNAAMVLGAYADPPIRATSVSALPCCYPATVRAWSLTRRRTFDSKRCARGWIVSMPSC